MLTRVKALHTPVNIFYTLAINKSQFVPRHELVSCKVIFKDLDFLLQIFEYFFLYFFTYSFLCCPIC